MKKLSGFLKAVITAGIIAQIIPAALSAIEIPLDGAVVAPGQAKDNNVKYSAAGIAYVDIEMIFNEHPMTARLKHEFEATVEVKKKELSDMESQINDMKNVIISTSTQIDKLKIHVELMKTALNTKPLNRRE